MSRMWLQRLLSLAAVCCCCLGCSVTNRLCETLCNEVKYRRAEHRVKRRERELARSAWNDLKKSSPEFDWSADNARGFHDGFAGFLHTGYVQPPPVPPERYWQMCRDSVKGWQATQDWFSGYRLGADAARQSGWRGRFTAPVSIGWCPPSAPLVPASPGEALPRPEPLAPGQAAVRAPGAGTVTPAAFLAPAPGVASGPARDGFWPLQ